MSEQQVWEQGRQLAIARALRLAVIDQYSNNGRFYEVVQAFIDEIWEPTIKPLPTQTEIVELLDMMVEAADSESEARG